jgi:predicted HNH restriction endonuclease
MHDRVAQTIKRLGWAEEAMRRFAGFYETADGSEELPTRRYFEGRRREARVIARARSGRARQECVEHHGVACVACGFDFEAVYGERGREFIEVHHLNPMASADAE